MGNRLDLRFRGIACLQDCLTHFEQTRPGRGWHNLGVPPLEQFHIQFRFQLRDICGDRRLRHRDAFRAFREPATFDDRDEVLDLIKVRCSSFAIYIFYRYCLAPVIINGY